MSYGKVLGRMETVDETMQRRESNNPKLRPVYNGWIFVKPLSRLPKQIENNSTFSCNAAVLDKRYSGEDDDFIEQDMLDRYMIFTPHEGKSSGYVCYDQIFCKDVGKHALAHKSFVPVPLLNLDKCGIENFEAFEKMLPDKAWIAQKVGISDEYEDTPNLLIVLRKSNNREFEAYIYSNIIAMQIGSSGISLQIQEPGKNKLPFDYEDMNHMVISGEDNVVFIPEEFELKYINQIAQNNGRSVIVSVEELSKADFIPRSNSRTFTMDDENKAALVDLMNSGTLKEKREVRFLDQFHQELPKLGLLYGDEDLVNFDFCVQTSQFVLLSGLSGTGKSQLVRAYAKIMPLVDEKNYELRMIPVSPSWTDDADILGFVDYKKEMYQPADTELVTFLKDAAAHPEKKYLVCFDEMNLAKVEHYFSQFISILEIPEAERRLVLYSESISNNISNKHEFPASIPVRNNVCFIGTVNIDESTTPLSDKLLDRAHKIELEIQPFTKIQELIGGKLRPQELQLLTELHSVIHSEQPKLGIGYRIIRQMGDYLAMADNSWMVFNRGKGIDYVVAQRIIPKLRGSVEQVGRLVGRYVPSESGQEEIIEDSLIMNILNDYSNLSDFIKVRNLLIRKAKELNIYGYTI